METLGILATTATRRALGENFVDALAPILHPAIAKKFLRMAESIQRKNAMLAYFPKPKGYAQHRDQIRLTADIPAKACHNAGRTRPSTLGASATQTPSQMGGNQKRNTDFGSHALRAILETDMSWARTTTPVFGPRTSAN